VPRPGFAQFKAFSRR